MSFFPSKPRHQRHFRTYAILFAYLIALCLGCLGCQAPKQIRADPAGATLPQVLRVGISGDYAPFSVWDWPPAPGTLLPRPPHGFSVDVARAYADARGISIEWVPFRWPELQADLERGRFDLALSGVTVRADRALVGRFSLPLTTSGAVILLPATTDSGRRMAAGDDLHSLLNRPEIRIAVNAGGHLEAVTRRLFPAAEILPVPANGKVLEQLQADANEGADAVMTDSREAPHWLGKQRGLIASRPLTQDRKAAWFALERADLVGDFDRWLLTFEAKGGLAELRKRSDLPGDTTARPIEALWATLDDRLGLMTRVAESKRILAKPIEDVPREALVIEAAVAGFEREALRRGLRDVPTEAVEDLFRAQIEAAKTIQRAHLEQARPLNAAPSPSVVPTAAERAAAQHQLDEVLRPALIFLGDRITQLLVAAQVDSDAPPAPRARIEALGRHGLTSDQIRSIERAVKRAVEALLKPGAETSAQANPPQPAIGDKPRSA